MPDRESKGDRLDRELGELLQELRVLLPGVQVLFAFLLTVPFTQRFDALTSPQRRLYLVTLICAAVATALLVAPSAFHRILFRERDKEWMILVANGLAITGTVFLAVAIAVAVFLVTELVYSTVVASLIAGGLGLVFTALWYVVPLIRRRTN